MNSKTAISSIDPYGIKEMQFNIKKSKKYTTVKSLIASLVVLALAVLISWDSLSHLWIHRKYLPRQMITKRTETGVTVNDMVVCVLATRNATSPPKVIIWNHLNKTLPLEDRSAVPTKYPYMMPYLNSSNYECVNMEGVFPNGTIYMSADVKSLFLIKTLTIEHVIDGAEPKILAVESDSVIYMKQQKYIIKDRLLIDYEPTVLVGFTVDTMMVQLQNWLVQPVRPNDGLYSNRTLIRPFQYTSWEYNLDEIIVERQNIGKILGKFFSWYSLFILIFVFLFEPMVEFAMTLELAKTVYSHELLNSLSTSMFVQLKFYLANCFGRCLKERIIRNAFNKLDKDMDIVNLLKKQIMMQKISKELQYSENKVELYVPDFEDNRNIDRDLLEKDPESDRSSEEQRPKRSNDSLFEVEAEELSFFKPLEWIDNFLCAFDMSETEIGLMYNKGVAHGSIWSILITVLGAGGLLAFLILSGVLSIQTDVKVFTELEDTSELTNFTYEFNRNSLFFSIFPFTPSFSPLLRFQLVNSNKKIIKNITMLRNQNCSDVTEGWTMTVKQALNIYCFPQNFTLFTNKQDSLTLRIQNNETKFFMYVAPEAYFFYKPIRFTDTGYENTRITTPVALLFIDNISTRYFELNLYNFENKTDQTIDRQYLALNVLKQQFIEYGLEFKITPRLSKAVVENSTIWDVLDNSWGIMVLSFEIIIFKLSRFINRKLKDSQTNSDREIERANIVNILANHDRLIHGSFREQLNAVRYYFKTNLSISDIQ